MHPPEIPSKLLQSGSLLLGSHQYCCDAFCPRPQVAEVRQALVKAWSTFGRVNIWSILIFKGHLMILMPHKGG